MLKNDYFCRIKLNFLMKKILLLIILLLPFLIKAQRLEVSGIQEGIWNYDTILVVGDVIVPEEMSLTIAEGTRVIFDDHYSILVKGKLQAVGSETDSIYFTSRDTAGFVKWRSGAGGWKGLVFQDIDDTVKLSYCRFSYGKATKDINLGGAVRIYNTDFVEINNCTFYHNLTTLKGGALYAEHSTIDISNCEVDSNFGFNEEDVYMHGAGFQFNNCNVNMEDMYFHDNYCPACYGGGANFDSCNVNINKAVFEDNYAVNAGGIGIQRSNDYEVKVFNILLNNNIAYHYGGAMAIAASSPLVYNVTMVNNYTIAAGGGALQFFDGARPVFKNCIIWGNDWYGEHNSISDGSQIFVWGSDCAPEFYYSVLEGGLENIHGNQCVAHYDQQSMIETDPCFIDTLNRNFQLANGSPAINRGTVDTTDMNLPPTDLVGMPRIMGDGIDMGCYESNATYLNEMNRKKNGNIYPNPINSNSVCKFLLENKSEVIVKIFNQNASLIFIKNYGIMESGINEINVSDFIESLQKNNAYFLSIESNEETRNIKFVY